MLQGKFPRNTSFLQRSASVASLISWKDRFDARNFAKTSSFVSYASESDLRKMEDGGGQKGNQELLNDFPPSYPDVVLGPCPGESVEVQPEKLGSCSQDFTALENYLKKKLSVKTMKNLKESNQSEPEIRPESVLNWLNELPEGDNLEEFLEAYGIPMEGVDMDELKVKLRKFLNERLTGIGTQDSSTTSTTPNWERQLSDLQELASDDNLEKWLESLDVPYFRPIPETKDEIRKYLQRQNVQIPLPTTQDYPSPPNVAAFVPKWQELVEKMKDLKNEESLDKWLESLEVPHNVPKDKVKAELKKFFMHETFENFAGKSIVLQERSLAHELWAKFEDAGVMKQVAAIAGTTAVLGLIAVLSTTMLSFAFPAAFAVNPYFTEVFAQYFLQRQEVAFNLLNFHAQNAKPLSTAWAKQYILWKYC